jgi:hypothetical protein
MRRATEFSAQPGPTKMKKGPFPVCPSTQKHGKRVDTVGTIRRFLKIVKEFFKIVSF